MPLVAIRPGPWGAVAVLIALLAPLAAVDPTVRALVDLDKPGSEQAFAAQAPAQVAISHVANGPGLEVAIAPGDAGFPGVECKPEHPWDLSVYGHVEAHITNTGATKLGLTLRLDNDGDWKANPWNGETLWLEPGRSGTLTVRFGYSWGKKGFALDPHQVSRLLFFVGKTDKALAFRIDSIALAGTPGEKPPLPADQVRTRPADGVLFGAGVAFDPATQLSAPGSTVVGPPEAGKASLRLAIPPAASRLSLKPAVGRWDLRGWLQVRLRLRNPGTSPIALRAHLEGGGATDEIPATVAAGAAAEIVVPFTARRVWSGAKGDGNLFLNDAAAAVVLDLDADAAERGLIIDGVVAEAAALALPEWLGTRPPTEGKWTRTFSDEFDGAAIDREKWNIYTENYWDKRTHFTAEDVRVGDGAVKLHYERKTGFHNDDPKRQQTDYACGFLDTYGRWTQRYGYFETRLKLPTAPGLWPAFWMMPDRGGAGPQWQRASTGEGGMEMDIVEHLTRWGPNRYNIAMHWDGYGKEHKSVGSGSIYAQPDQDGFIVAGLLWEPGCLTYYANGAPVLCWKDPRVSSVPGYLIYDVVSGGWDNDALDDAKLPADLVVDWVRCWQREDLAQLPQAAPATP
jgi:beta-glucanase (GH16 family)